VLYHYELYRGAATAEQDYGHLVFTEATQTKYLLVNIYGSEACDCGSPYHQDYAAMVKLQAQRFMNLLVYLQGEKGPRPKWVRATFTTAKRPAWHPKFLTKTGIPNRLTSTYAPIVHLTADDLIPSLRSKDLARINNTISKSAEALAQYVREEDRARVLDDRAAKTSHVTPHLAKKETQKGCAGCDTWGPAKKLKFCNGCHLVQYCSQQCQRNHWDYHKLVCSKTVPASDATRSKRSAKEASERASAKQIEPPPLPVKSEKASEKAPAKQIQPPHPPVKSLNDLD